MLLTADGTTGALGSRFEGGAVLAQLGVAGGDLSSCLLGERRREDCVVLTAREDVNGAREGIGAEQPGQPLIQAGRQPVFAQVDRSWLSGCFRQQSGNGGYRPPVLALASSQRMEICPAAPEG